MSHIILVAGPARSGKSEWAETLAARSDRSVTYIATSRIDPTDAEWLARIERHRQRRLPDWTTLEVPMALAEAIDRASESDCLLVDSLGTWVANWIDRDEAIWNQAQETLLASLADGKADAILVAEEIGWGVIPAYPMGRTFRDRLGTLVRRIGAMADSVYLVVAGHVLELSALGMRLPD